MCGGPWPVFYCILWSSPSRIVLAAFGERGNLILSGRLRLMERSEDF